MTHMRGKAAITLVVAALALLSYPLAAQAPVTYERLLNAAKEPHNWLTYGGDYFSNRHSPLTQITPGTEEPTSHGPISRRSRAAGSHADRRRRNHVL